MSRQEICMMRMQALIKGNTTQAWFGRSKYLEGGNQGLSKHASTAQTEYTRSPAGSGMTHGRDSPTRSLRAARSGPFCHSVPPGTLPNRRKC